MTNESLSRIKKLKQEGWIEQFIASEPRLSEAVELYKEAGFDVHLEPLPEGKECEACAGPEETADPEGTEECRVCFEGVEDRHKIIFTRLRLDASCESTGRDGDR